MVQEVEEMEETCFYGQDLFVSQMVKLHQFITESVCAPKLGCQSPEGCLSQKTVVFMALNGERDLCHHIGIYRCLPLTDQLLCTVYPHGPMDLGHGFHKWSMSLSTFTSVVFCWSWIFI